MSTYNFICRCTKNVLPTIPTLNYGTTVWDLGRGTPPSPSTHTYTLLSTHAHNPRKSYTTEALKVTAPSTNNSQFSNKNNCTPFQSPSPKLRRNSKADNSEY
jgi:hypothetical protein